MFKLALIQMQVEGGNKVRNLRRAEELIASAAARGAKMVLLPEAMDLGWTHPTSTSEAEPVPQGFPCRVLAGAARAHSLYVCAGLTERDGNHVFNSAVLVDPSGQVILKHRKLNELEIGHPYYSQGDRLNVCRTELGTVGLFICADGFAQDQVLSRALGYMGADIILSPSAWAVEADHDNVQDPYGNLWRSVYKPVAREFALWIASTSNVGWLREGPWQGRKCIGCSLVISPEGEEVIQGAYGVDAEEILYVDISPVQRPARGDTWHRFWEHRSG